MEFKFIGKYIVLKSGADVAHIFLPLLSLETSHLKQGCCCSVALCLDLVSHNNILSLHAYLFSAPYIISELICNGRRL